MRILTVPTLPLGGVAMTATPRQRTDEEQAQELRAQITEALTEVRGAEASVAHCASVENQEFLTAAWYRLDRLLDRLPRAATE